jgi:sporulation protein YlmC with PRC-barrel domain
MELREKLVFDWNNFAVGKIRDAEVDPKTRTVRSLVISLSDEARSKMGARPGQLVIPINYVFGIRRGEVTLDRSFDELRRIDAQSPSLPPPL